MRRYRIVFFLGMTTFLCHAQDHVTWSDQVACLVYTHCTPCHNASGIAPFTLESYEDAFANRFRMEEAISQRKMPPWPPNANYSRLRNERLLSDHEVAVFQAWIRNGAQEGDLTMAPTTPVITTNIEITEPDLSYILPPYTVPDLQELDLYRCFRIPTNETEDRFITGVEIVPGNRGIVHHVLLFADTSDIPRQLDSEDPGPGYTCFGGIGSESFTTISGWVPGSDANFTPEGMGIMLPTGADLIVQLHYPEGSAGQVDATTINLQFAEEPNLRPLLNIPAINHFTSLDEPLVIPANTRKTFHASQEVPFDLTITGIAPHAHLICESMRAFAVTPIGDTIKLIDIPHWDFEWQGFYDFQIAKRLPFGSIVHGIVTYNNTTSNPHLPNDSPVDVKVGEATTDEMLLFFMTLTFYIPGDENMIIDTSSHFAHHQDCSTDADLTLSNIDNLKFQEILVGPNPSHGEVFISLPDELVKSSNISFVMSDMFGRSLSIQHLKSNPSSIQLPGALTSGVYWFQFQETGGKMIGFPRKLTLLK